MAVIPFKDVVPEIGTEVFIAPTAWVTGKVTIKDNVSIFFGAALRGDIQKITIGTGTNLQEHVVVHTSTGLQDCVVGDYVTVGHGAIVHGCTVEDNCIIGMGSTILDGARIGKNSIVGAQALVPMNMQIPEGSMVLGVPAKVVRRLTEKEIEGIYESALHYIEVGGEYRRYFETRQDKSGKVYTP